MAKLVSGIPLRRLGKTGWEVSSLSLGCSPFGDVFGSLKFEDCRSIAKESFNCGINYFDTSPFYGLKKSETVLGNVLNSIINGSDNEMGICRNDFYLSSKVGRYDANTFDFSSKRIEESIEESLNRLQTDYLDLVLTHDIEFASNIEQIWNETLPTLEMLKNKGKIKKIGVSGRPLIVLDYVLKQFGFNRIDCILTYNNYVLFDTNLLNFVFKWKNKYNIGIIQGGFTGLGLLTTNANPPQWNNSPNEFKLACKEAIEIIPHLYEKYENNNNNNNEKYDLARLAFIFTHSMPLIDTTLVGMTKVNELNKMIDWINNSKNGINEIDKLVINELQNTVFADIMNRGWYDDTMQENICKSMKNYWK